jgi:KDO2-lipid IV(A) lauroyltransferase
MLVLLRCLSHWPLWLLHAVGALLGWITWAASPSYRRRLRENADRAGVSAADRRASVAEAGRLVSELPRLWLRPVDRPIADPVHWVGAERLQAWLGQGRGLVLLTPHLGSFEVSAQAYAERFGHLQPITVLYRPARKQALRELEETARAHRAGHGTGHAGRRAADAAGAEEGPHRGPAARPGAARGCRSSVSRPTP